MTLRLLRSALVLFLALALAPPAAAQTSHYVAPPGWQGAGTGDGTQANPWRSIGDALKAAAAGDTLLLMDGSYGGLRWTGSTAATPEKPITIRSLNGKGAHFEWIHLQWQANNLTFRDLSLWPTQAPVGRPTGNLVFAERDISNIVVDGLDIRGRVDAPNSMFTWTVEEWSALPNGIMIGAPNSRIANNTITGIGFAIQTRGDSADNVDITGNVIDGFNGDGIRPLGDNTRVIGNRITNSFNLSNGNHDDGIQSWVTKNGVQVGLRLEENVIIGWTGPPGHPLRAVDLQGIGLFDGPFEGLVIRNNLVAVTHVWGIAAYGARNAVISHNTAVDLEPGLKWSPKISARNHKNGTPPENVLVTNNLAMSFETNAPAGSVTFAGNSVISSPGAVFEDPAAYDYRPRADSGFIDTADPAHAAARDVFGNARPQGNGPDRGAVELGGAGGGQQTPVEEAPPPEEPAPEEPAQPEQPPAEGGDTGSGGTPDGGSTGDGGGDTGSTDGSTEPAPSPGPKFEKPPKKDTPNKGKGAGKQALKAEKAARREARRAARASARAAAPVVSTKAPVLSGVSTQSVGFWR